MSLTCVPQIMVPIGILVTSTVLEAVDIAVVWKPHRNLALIYMCMERGKALPEEINVPHPSPHVN